MTHFLLMTVTAAAIGLIFGGLTQGTLRQKTLFGVKSFLQFMIIGLILAWGLYLLPL